MISNTNTVAIHGPYNGVPWWVWLFVIGGIFVGVGWALLQLQVNPGIDFSTIGKLMIATPFAVVFLRILLALI